MGHDYVVEKCGNGSVVFELLPDVVLFRGVTRDFQQNSGIERRRLRASSVLFEHAPDDSTVWKRRQAAGLHIDSQIGSMDAAWSLARGISERAEHLRC